MSYLHYYREMSWFDYEGTFKKMRGDDHLIILNSIPFSDPEYVSTIAKMVHARGNQTDFIATCQCGTLSGNYLEGVFCEDCRTFVRNDMESGRDGYPYRTWVEIPPILPHGWLHPTAYSMLREWTRYSVTKKEPKTYIDAILNPDIPLSEIPEELKYLASRGRGFAFLKQNFREFINTVCDIPKYRKDKKKRLDTDDVIECLRRFKDRLWVTHLPILHSSLHALVAPDGGTDNKKNYTDKNSRHVSQLASTLSQIQFEGEDLSEDRLNRMFFQAYMSYHEYAAYAVGFIIDKKEGIARQHIFGARYHWSVRAVITPLTGKHDIDEIHLPYTAGVNMFRIELLGRLVHEFKMLPVDAWARFDRALTTFDEDI